MVVVDGSHRNSGSHRMVWFTPSESTHCSSYLTLASIFSVQQLTPVFTSMSIFWSSSQVVGAPPVNSRRYTDSSPHTLVLVSILSLHPRRTQAIRLVDEHSPPIRSRSEKRSPLPTSVRRYPPSLEMTLEV